VDFKSFLATLRLYWRTFTLAAVIVLVLGLWWLLAARDQYVSTAQLLVSLQGSTTAEAYENDDVIQSRVNSYIALLTTDAVSQRVIDKLGLSLTPPELSAKISATNVPPKTAILDVAVTDDSPEQARVLAQTVADQFVSYANALEAPTGAGAQKVSATVVTAASEPHQRRLELVGLGLLTTVVALLTGAIAVIVRSRTDPVVRTAFQASVAAGAPVLGRVVRADAAATEDLDDYPRLRIRLRSMGGTEGGRDREAVSPDDHTDSNHVAHSLERAMELGGERPIVLWANTAERPAQPVAMTMGSVADNDQDDGPDALQVRWWADRDLEATYLSSRLIAQLHADADADYDYDYVVLAASSGETLPGTGHSSGYAKEALLLVSPGRSKRRDVAAAAESIRQTGALLAGLLLTADGDA
jgi:capsular polysaccharide biosynthesis protein